MKICVECINHEAFDWCAKQCKEKQLDFYGSNSKFFMVFDEMKVNEAENLKITKDKKSVYLPFIFIHSLQVSK